MTTPSSTQKNNPVMSMLQCLCLAHHRSGRDPLFYFCSLWQRSNSYTEPFCHHCTISSTLCMSFLKQASSSQFRFCDSLPPRFSQKFPKGVTGRVMLSDISAPSLACRGRCLVRSNQYVCSLFVCNLLYLLVGTNSYKGLHMAL